MRRLFTFLLLLLGGSSLFAQLLTPEVLYYKFDGSGTSVPNLASAPPVGTTTATIMGGLTQGGSGTLCDGTIIGTGAASSTDYVNTGWAPNIGTGSWSISWRSSGISTNTTLYYIFGDANTASFRCFTNGVAGSTNWIIRGAGLTDVYINGGALATPTHCTYVYDQPLNQVRAYLNGVLVSTVAQTAPNLTGTGPLKVIGYSTNVGAPLGGILDEFRVYSRALTQAEITQLVNPWTPSGFLGADGFVCPGDSTELTLPDWPSTTVAWSTGSTGDSTWVNSAGTYSVAISGACGAGNDTVNVTTAPALPGPGFAGPDDTICVGDTIALSVSTTDSILWSTGDTTDTIWVSATGTYTVSISGQCGTVMDTIEVDSSALIYSGFAVADTSAACEGDTIGLGTSGTFDTYAWSTGDTTQMSWATSTGTYYVSVTDGCGSGTDSVSVSFTAGVNASFSFSVNMMSATFTNSSTGGGTVGYSWNFGDGSPANTTQNPSYTYAANGTYLVTLTVTNECGTSTFSDSVTINFVGIANGLDFDAIVAPNPATDRVMVAATLPEAMNIQVSVVSTLGQVMYSADLGEMSGDLKHAIDLNGFARGVYFVRLQAGDKQLVTRLVKQN
jgi:PKD repeat protein